MANGKDRPILFSGPTVREILADRKTQTRRVIKMSPRAEAALANAARPVVAMRPDESSAWAGNRAHARWQVGNEGFNAWCPYGDRGDRLWVRETCIIAPKGFTDWVDDSMPRDKEGARRLVQYIATHPDRQAADDYGVTKATPSIHMPRWASRITLEIKSVRVERLQDISEADAKAEGITGPHYVGYEAYRVPDDSKPRYSSAVAAFESLWDSINHDRAPWSSNPWVWRVEFARVKEG